MIDELKAWGEVGGALIPDLSAKEVSEALDRLIEPAWKKAWRQKVQDVEAAIRQHLPALRAELARLHPSTAQIELYYRGSLARGMRYDKQTGNLKSFEPRSFDCDAFVISDELVAALGGAQDGMVNGGRVPQLRTIHKRIRASLNKIEGYRDDDFDVYIRTREAANALKDRSKHPHEPKWKQI